MYWCTYSTFLEQGWPSVFEVANHWPLLHNVEASMWEGFLHFCLLSPLHCHAFSVLIIKQFSPSPSFLQFHLLGAEVCSSPQPFLVFLCWLQLCPCLFFCASMSSHVFQDVPVAPVLFDSFALYTSAIVSNPKNRSWIPAVPKRMSPCRSFCYLLTLIVFRVFCVLYDFFS